MMKRRLIALCGFVLVLVGVCARADTFFPMLMYVSPIAIQQGTVTECEVAARYDLAGTYRVFVTGDGVKAEPVGEPVKPAESKGKGKRNRGVNRLKVRFTVAADALPGPREVRLATPLGVSTVAQVVVVKDPIVRETPNNDTMATAQPITLPATVCGSFEKAEDVDFYKFNVAANTALTFHVRCQRLEHRIHDLQELADPILTLRNAAGTVLAVSDNYFFGDPLLAYRFAASGEYLVDRKTSHDQRFEREFAGLKKFEPISRAHEGLVNILHVGRNEATGQLYYVMELADSCGSDPANDADGYIPKTLKTRLESREAIQTTECLRLSLAITSALAFLHEQGLVHRDIKPSNIIFVLGQPKLADIGLVAGSDETPPLSEPKDSSHRKGRARLLRMFTVWAKF